MYSLPDTRWKKFALNLGVWIVVGTLFTLQSYVYRIHAGQNITWWQLYPYELFFFLSCGLCTPFIVAASRRFPVTRKEWLLRISTHLGLAITGAITHRFFYELISQSLRATLERPFSWETLARNVIGFSDYGFLIYFIVLFVVHAIDYNKQMVNEQVTTAYLKEQLLSAQLHALKMQLQPHFLFNTLNTISILIQEDAAKAEKMVGVLSDLLRFTLKHSSDQELTLQEELEFLSMYVHIEQARFAERLTVHYDIESEVRGSYIPTLILQPLVENAIKHGIAQKRGAGEITVGAKKEGDMVLVSIRDNGMGLLHKAENSAQEGIGLSNSVARLNALYGDRARINVKNLDGSGALTEISLPFHTQKMS